MERSVLSIGSNLGDRLTYLEAAVDDLAATTGIAVRGVSSVYETPPWLPVTDSRFYSIVAIVETNLDPFSLLDTVQEIETRHGRTRGLKWSPRTLDIDIITFGDEESSDQELTLPHPLAHERPSVLLPWLELDEDAKIAGVPCKELVEKLDCSGIVRLGRLR